MFIYDEHGNLTIRKPNGLEYSFNNTDKPELGFEYQVIVYDDIEVKIVDGKKEYVSKTKQKSILMIQRLMQ